MRIVTAREQEEMLSPWRVVASKFVTASFLEFSLRSAHITDDLYYGLSRQFTQWANQNGKTNPRDDGLPRKKQRGPAGYWPHIEDFMKENYPAAHKGLEYGMEQAQPRLDSSDMTDPYETGPEAHAKHGYDPKETAAAMLMLHNDTHPGRQEWKGRDTNRLTDIMQKRMRMQRDYEQRQQQPQQPNTNLDGVFKGMDEMGWA